MKKWIRSLLLFLVLLFLMPRISWGEKSELGGFDVEIGEGVASFTPAVSKPAASVTAAPTKPPEVISPTMAPTVTKKPSIPVSSAPKPVEKPASPIPSLADIAPSIAQTPPAQSVPKITREATPFPVEEESRAASFLVGEKKLEPKKDSAKTPTYTAREKDAAGDSTEEVLYFFHKKGKQSLGFVPEIRVRSRETLQVLSFRINGEEIFWRWRGCLLVPENFRLRLGENRVELLVLLGTGEIREMDTWKFFVEK